MRGRGGRLTERLRSGKSRSASSRAWLERQLNDPFVAEAKARGYRSRAAFKLAGIDERAKLLKPGMAVVDLGAAPGGWLPVAAERVGAAAGKGRVVGIDLLRIDPVPGAVILEGDFLADDAPARLRDALGGPADLVLSDMAPAASGQPDIDHLRIVALAEAALDFAGSVLKPGGAFVTKLLPGSDERSFIEALRRRFAAVKRVKPPASRADSAEFFLVATGFEG